MRAEPLSDSPAAPPCPLLAQALAHFHRRELTQAAACCQAILDAEPQRVDALSLLGAVEAERGRFDAAIEGLQRAVALQPQHHASLINLAMALGLAARDEEALAAIERVLELRPADAQAHHIRATLQRRLGRLFDALESLDQSLAADPAQADVLAERGELLADLSDFGMHRRDEAVQSLHQALALGGDEASIRFSLAAMGAGIAPPAPPKAFVTQLFDRYADRFDQQLLGELAYRAPELIARAVQLAAPPPAADVLDLGCGTGLCGPFLRPLAGWLVGVDLSSRMLAKADARGLYDELVQADIVAHLAGVQQGFDLIVAADVLVYLGDLAPLFAAVQRALRPGGCFVFSIESQSDQDFVLRATRRYAHADAYVQRLAEEQGFGVELLTPAVLRINNGAEVEGRVLSLRRPAHASLAPQPPVDPVESRLVELEIKASFAEDTLDQLNQVIVRQQQQIDALARELARWREQAMAANPDPARSLRDELPPHY